MTDKELNEIRERANRATPGPWITDYPFGVSTSASRYDSNFPESRHDGNLWYLGICSLSWRSPSRACPYWQQEMDDMEFIASARTDIVALLDEVERLRDEH